MHRHQPSVAVSHRGADRAVVPPIMADVLIVIRKIALYAKCSI
ncbi:hypothetical protein [Undibacterium macrobrachii]|nr:hypothetical protein [Undibacterium macrobrachii]